MMYFSPSRVQLDTQYSSEIQELPASESGLWTFGVSGSSGPRSLNAFPEHDEDELRWYLQQHFQEPFAKERASNAEEYLTRYCRILSCAVALPPVLSSGSGPEAQARHLFIRESNQNLSTFYSVHWELLERSSSMSGDQHPVQVSRLVDAPTDTERSQQIVSALKSSKTFNILMFVSRPDILKGGQADVNFRLVSRPLFNILKSLPEGLVSIEVARPGTWKGFRDHLRDAKARGKYFHLVHLDVHGKVTVPARKKNGSTALPSAKLLFLKDACGGQGSIPASQVAAVLRECNVPALSLNACESARSDAGLKANLAKTFVMSGIPLVLAMSYKLLDSAAEIFMRQFYQSMFLDRHSFPTCAYEGRRALFQNKHRAACFGFTVELSDWMVPVTYHSKDVHFWTTFLTDAIPCVTDEAKISYLSSDAIPNAAPSSSGSSSTNSSTSTHNKSTRLCYRSLETDIFRAETLLLTQGSRIMLVEAELGVAMTQFFEQAAQWWRESRFTRVTVLMKWSQEEGFPPENMVERRKLTLLGQKMAAEGWVEDDEACLSRLAEFFSMNNALEDEDLYDSQHHVEDIAILDGIPLCVRKGAMVGYMVEDLATWIRGLAGDNGFVCVGSCGDLSRLKDELGDVPTLTLRGSSGEPEESMRQPEFLRFLRNPPEWRCFQQILDWCWHIPAYEDLARRLVSKFGLDTAQELVFSGCDVLYWLFEEDKEADKYAKRLPGYAQMENAFGCLSPDDQAKLLLLGLSSNVVPYQVDDFSEAAAEKLRVTRKPTRVISWLSKRVKRLLPPPPRKESNRIPTVDSVSILLGLLVITGLVGHKDVYPVLGKDEDTMALKLYGAPCKLHPAMSLFLRRSLRRAVSTRKMRKLCRRHLEHHQRRLGDEDGEPGKTLRLFTAEITDPSSPLPLHINKLEKDLGLWNFVSSMSFWLDDHRYHDDTTYPLLFYHHFMEPEQWKYERLDDPLFISIAGQAVLTLAEVHDKKLRSWHRALLKLQKVILVDIGSIGPTSEAGQFQTAYLEAFITLFAYTNWLCRSARHREEHGEFELWATISAKLLHATKFIDDESPLQIEPQEPLSIQVLRSQVPNSRRMLALHQFWPESDTEGGFEDIEGLDSPELVSFKDLILLCDRIRRNFHSWGFLSLESGKRAFDMVHSEVKRVSEETGQQLPTYLATVPAETLLRLRLIGFAPEGDGVPWPDTDLEQLYEEGKAQSLVSGVVKNDNWLKENWPKFFFRALEHQKHSKALNKGQLQALMAMEQWYGCLAYLDKIESIDDGNSDKASWAICRAKCLSKLHRYDEAAVQASTAFELCKLLKLKNNSMIRNLRDLFYLIQSWPSRDLSNLPAAAEILLHALKAGFARTMGLTYACNGALMILLLNELSESLLDVDSIAENSLLLDAATPARPNDPGFAKTIDDLSANTGYTKEELAEELGYSWLSPSFNSIFNHVGTMESTITGAAIGYGSRTFDEYRRIRAVRQPYETKQSRSWEEEMIKRMPRKYKEVAATVDENLLNYVDLDSTAAQSLPCQIPDVCLREGLALEIFELLLQTRHKDGITPAEIAKVARRRLLKDLSWRQVNRPFTIKFLERFAPAIAGDEFGRDNEAWGGFFRDAETLIMRGKYSENFLPGLFGRLPIH